MVGKSLHARGGGGARQLATDKATDLGHCLGGETTVAASVRGLPQLEAVAFGIDGPPEAADAVDHLDRVVDGGSGGS